MLVARIPDTRYDHGFQNGDPMSHGFPPDEFIAIGWVFLAVWMGVIAMGERGWSRAMFWFLCFLSCLLTVAFGYGAFIQMVSR